MEMEKLKGSERAVCAGITAASLQPGMDRSAIRRGGKNLAICRASLFKRQRCEDAGLKTVKVWKPVIPRPQPGCSGLWSLASTAKTSPHARLFPQETSYLIYSQPKVSNFTGANLMLT